MALEEHPVYVRQERQNRLGFSTKLFQGLGAIPDTIKNIVFNTFILLFYNQILGVDALLVSIALAIAIVFDAITDPLVASYSDNLKSRWGRRHPLMLVSSMPLGICLFFVFVPPGGLSQTGLFVWLLTFVVLTRGFMTLYFVPWASIAAELSDDYDERTSVMMFRFAVGWIVGTIFPLTVYNFIMTSSPEYPVGQLNPASYPMMALYAGLLLSGGALLTTLLTRREIPYLRQHSVAGRQFAFFQVIREFKRSFRNPHFVLYFAIVLLAAAISGTTANIGIYMTTFFWGLTPEDLRWYAIATIGAIIAFPVVGILQGKWDKKYILLTCSILALIDGVTLVNLRFFNVLPNNGEPLLLVILISMYGFGAFIAVVQGVISASMVADILDDHELQTGYRQEGMFNAALSFSGKAISGVGIILGGMIINLIDFPIGMRPAEVPAEIIFRLGLVVGVIVPLFHLIPISLITRYKITRQVHKDIQTALARKKTMVITKNS